MHIIPDSYREPASRVTYQVTDKEPGKRFGAREKVSKQLVRDRVFEQFGTDWVTMGEIYHDVLGPLGYSLMQTKELVGEAVGFGYLQKRPGKFRLAEETEEELEDDSSG